MTTSWLKMEDLWFLPACGGHTADYKNLVKDSQDDDSISTLQNESKISDDLDFSEG
jgi:hypothetical protein